MKKAIVTPAIFALIVLLAGVFFLHDEFELLQNSTVETATVSSCDSKRFRRSGKRSNGYVLVWPGICDVPRFRLGVPHRAQTT